MYRYPNICTLSFIYTHFILFHLPVPHGHRNATVVQWPKEWQMVGRDGETEWEGFVRSLSSYTPPPDSY